MAALDTIIVGLGAMGSSTLYELSRRGQRVLGLEAFAPGHELGSSHGESRVIRLAYFEHPNYVPLLRRAFERWTELEQESGEHLLRMTGGLMIGAPDTELVSGAHASALQHGLEYRFMTPAEVAETYPALRLGEHEVALWEPNAGFLRPERSIETYLRLARGFGAETRFETPVTSWRARADHVEVVTDTETFVADQAVFTCGARIASVLGGDIAPVRAERAVLFWMEPERLDWFAPNTFPIYLWEFGPGEQFYGFPHVDWPGVKVARHHSGDFLSDPDAVDRTVSAQDESRLRHALAGRIPALNGRVLEARVCLYENSPDTHFLIDHVPEHGNVVFAGGFSGHGFKFASVVGEIVADLITRGTATEDAAFLRRERLLKASVS